ncbi:MAG: hypothetical protein R2731_03460 [Nocardioides sp.]
MSLRHHVNYANVTATVALVVALGGTSYAATQITSAQIKNGTIQNIDVKADTLKGDRIKNHSIGAKDLAKGATTAAYSTFHDGGVSIQSQVGSQDPVVLTLSIPTKGSYVIVGKTWIANGSGSAFYDRCRLYAGTDFDQARQLVQAPDYSASTMTVVHTFGAPGQAELRCYSFGVPSTANDSKITAIKVDSLSNVGG